MGKMKELHYKMQEILEEYRNGMSRDSALFSLWQLGLSSEDASNFLRRGHYLKAHVDNKKAPRGASSLDRIDVV